MIRFDAEPSAYAKSGFKTGRPGPSAGETDARPNPFERLVEIWKGNERLLSELKGLRPRIEGTAAYLADPDCPNPTLGRAYLERLGRRREAALARLREHRREAMRLLAPAPEPCPR